MKEWFKKTFCYDVKVNRPFYRLILDCVEMALIISLLFGAILYYIVPQKLEYVIKFLEGLKENIISPNQFIISTCCLIFVIIWGLTMGVVVNLSYEQEKQEKLKKKKKAKE